MPTKINSYSKLSRICFKVNSIKGKSKHHANYILCEKCFKCNILPVVNSGSTAVNGGNEGFLCEVIVSLKCITVRTLEP